MLLRQRQRAALLLSTKEMKQILGRQEEGKYRVDVGLCEVELPCSIPSYLTYKTCTIHLLKKSEVEGSILFSLLCPDASDQDFAEECRPMAMRGDFFLLFADKSIQPTALVNHRSYESFKELRNEFRAKIGTYVDRDFDWNHHIGYAQYIEKELY